MIVFSIFFLNPFCLQDKDRPAQLNESGVALYKCLVC